MNWKTDDLRESILELFTENIHNRVDSKEFNPSNGFTICDKLEQCEDQNQAQ